MEYSDQYFQKRKIGIKGAVQAIDEKLEKVENIYYPINKIMRKEQGEQAKCLLKEIQKKRKNNKDGKFELPEIEDFAKYIKVTTMKADSDEPNDIFMQIDDTHSSHDLGFSIKLFIGGIEDENTYDHEEDDAEYLMWMRNLPRYYVEGNTIFVHAGIDEEAEDLWEWGTDDYTLSAYLRLRRLL